MCVQRGSDCVCPSSSLKPPHRVLELQLGLVASGRACRVALGRARAQQEVVRAIFVLLLIVQAEGAHGHALEQSDRHHLHVRVRVRVRVRRGTLTRHAERPGPSPHTITHDEDEEEREAPHVDSLDEGPLVEHGQRAGHDAHHGEQDELHLVDGGQVLEHQLRSEKRAEDTTVSKDQGPVCPWPAGKFAPHLQVCV